MVSATPSKVLQHVPTSHNSLSLSLSPSQAGDRLGGTFISTRPAIRQAGGQKVDCNLLRATCPRATPTQRGDIQVLERVIPVYIYIYMLLSNLVRPQFGTTLAEAMGYSVRRSLKLAVDNDIKPLAPEQKT